MRRAPAALVIVVVTLLAACANSSQTRSALTGSEARFVSQMIPHHELGVKLVNDATLHSNGVQLRRMVFEMSGYHGSELDQLHSLSHSHNIADASDFPGSLPTDALDELASLSGPAYDTRWLNLMIIHHEGALAIASAVSGDGTSETISSLVVNTRTVQSKELAQMRELLSELCAADSSLPGC